MKQLGKLPFDDLRKESDILDFGGPVLSHFKDAEGKDFLFYWVDDSGERCTWLVFYLGKHDLHWYLSGYVSLKDLIMLHYELPVYLVDTDKEANYHNVREIMRIEIPEDYLPSEKSFFTLLSESAHNIGNHP